MEIQNYVVYNSRMAKTLMDKIWWLDKIDDGVDTIIDFRCADGRIMGLIETIQPGRFKYVGIDFNKEMLELAKCNAPKGLFYSNFLDMIYDRKVDNTHSILLFNSVIHEIMTYSSEDEIRNLSCQIKNFNPQYIAIRDMHKTSYYGDDGIDIDQTFDGIFRSAYMKEWLDYWHSKSNVHDGWMDRFSEFFLKYSYKENWGREKDEIYLWDWMNTPFNNYSIVESYSFNIPYITNKITKDFKVDWSNVMTHAKMLLRSAKE